MGLAPPPDAFAAGPPDVPELDRDVGLADGLVRRENGGRSVGGLLASFPVTPGEHPEHDVVGEAAIKVPIGLYV
jgi:hypothetical protein